MKAHGTRLAYLIVGLAMTLVLLFAPPVEAQSPPWPNGCSVFLPFYVQQGIDGLFLGACDQHDRCWAECNGPSPPFLGLGHRAQCDIEFLADMETACILEAAFLAFPIGGFDSAGDFITHCSGVAATFYGAVSTPFGTGFFWASQCRKGCNPVGCAQATLPFPTTTCGYGVGPAFCYIVYEPPPPPSPNLCNLIDCAEWCGTAIGSICCPGGCGCPGGCTTPCLTSFDPGDQALMSKADEEPENSEDGPLLLELGGENEIWNCGC